MKTNMIRRGNRQYRIISNMFQTNRAPILEIRTRSVMSNHYSERLYPNAWSDGTLRRFATQLLTHDVITFSREVAQLKIVHYTGSTREMGKFESYSDALRS